MFVHLKRGSTADQIAWEECPSHLKISEFEAKRDAHQDATGYNIATGMQRLLSGIRTDLDSFTDIEAYALMTSAYRMTAAQLDGGTPAVPGFGSVIVPGDWKFLRIEGALKPAAVAKSAAQQRSRVSRILDAGASMAFKIWKLSP